MANIDLNDASITFYCNAVSGDSKINFIVTGHIGDWGKFYCSTCEVNFIDCDNVTINEIYNNNGDKKMYATKDDNGNSFIFSITIGELMAYSLKFCSGTFEYPFRNMYDNIFYFLALDYDNDCVDKTSYFPHLQEIDYTFDWMSGTIVFNDEVNMITIKSIGSSTHCDNLIIKGDVGIGDGGLYSGKIKHIQIDKPVYIGEIAFGSRKNININTFSNCVSIGAYAFSDCNITQNNGSTLTLHGKIAEGAFLHATGFDTIDITGVSDIGQAAFAKIPSLININGFRGGYSGGTQGIFSVGKPYSSIYLLVTYVTGSGAGGYNWDADNRYYKTTYPSYFAIKVDVMDNVIKIRLKEEVDICGIKVDNNKILYTGLTTDLQTFYTGAFVKAGDTIYQFTDRMD